MATMIKVYALDRNADAAQRLGVGVKKKKKKRGEKRRKKARQQKGLSN